MLKGGFLVLGSRSFKSEWGKKWETWGKLDISPRGSRRSGPGGTLVPLIRNGSGIFTVGAAQASSARLECGWKLPNRLPNFRQISCLISCLIVRSSLNRNLGFVLIGDALRDNPATPEMGTFVPNGRRHGAMAAAGGPAKKRKSN